MRLCTAVALVVLAGLVVSGPVQAGTILGLDPGNDPWFYVTDCYVHYTANYYDTGHGLLQIGGMDLTGYPAEVYGSDGALILDWNHQDASYNYDVVFECRAEIDHSGSAISVVAGSVRMTGDFDGTWTGQTKPEGYGDIPVVTLVNSNTPTALGFYGIAWGSYFEFTFAEQGWTPLVDDGHVVGLIITARKLSPGSDYSNDDPLQSLDFSENFTGEEAYLYGYHMPEPSTIAFISLGFAVFAARRRRKR